MRVQVGVCHETGVCLAFTNMAWGITAILPRHSLCPAAACGLPVLSFLVLLGFFP